MRFGVLSDNHYDEAALAMILEREDDISLWFHCGDSQFSSEDRFLKQCVCVKGNTDHASFPNERMYEVAGEKILITHGHLYHIDFTCEEICLSAKIQGASLVLHGHTHIPRDIIKDQIRIVNPGSTSWPRGGHLIGTYACIDTVGDHVTDWQVTFYETLTGQKYQLESNR